MTLVTNADLDALERKPDALDRLAELLRLAENGLRVLAVRLFGNGLTASLEVDLSNGETIECDRVKDLWTASGMGAWITWSVGIDAGKITKANATEACGIMARIAAKASGRRLRPVDLGRDHGLGFLQAAPLETFRLNDQADRYRAFALLDRLKPTDPDVDPFERTRWPDAETIARRSLVLLDVTGWGFVKTGHLFSYVKALGQVSHPLELGIRMSLAGWERAGKRGDTTATPIGGLAPRLKLRLWRIPPGWGEEDDDDE